MEKCLQNEGIMGIKQMERQMKTAVRIPSDTHSWLRAYAQLNSRSMNKQLIVMLREAMRRHPVAGMQAMTEREIS